MQAQQDFIVIDTEGKNELREIAVIDSQGKLVYEAFAIHSTFLPLRHIYSCR
jgi:hypothetical protein